MSFDALGAGALDYSPCRYGTSKLLFRGPQRRLDAPYVAFLGGTDTYGKFLKTPFPALVEQELGIDCINLGIPNAGIDVLAQDSFLSQGAGEAVVTRANWQPSMTAALLGAIIIAAVGFAPGIAHLAGHDVRHTMVYPCH